MVRCRGMLAEMSDPLEPDRCAELLGALAAPERLQIVRILRDGPKSVSELAELVGAAVVNVSHHLGVLRHAGLVRNERKGRCIVYSLSPDVRQPDEHLNLGCCRLELPRDE